MWMPDGEARECGFAVIALGKLGGKELNYSSDIDLMFVYTANGETDGAEPHHQQGILQEGRQPVYRTAFHLHAPRASATAWICGCGRTGGCGEVCISLDGARHYYQTRAAIGRCRC